MRNEATSVSQRAWDLGINLCNATMTIYRDHFWRTDVKMSDMTWEQKAEALENTIQAENFRIIPSDGPLDEEYFLSALPERWEPEVKKEALEMARGWYSEGL